MTTKKYTEIEKKAVELVGNYFLLTKDSLGKYSTQETLNSKENIVKFFDEIKDGESSLINNSYRAFIVWETFRNSARSSFEDMEDELHGLKKLIEDDNKKRNKKD